MDHDTLKSKLYEFYDDELSPADAEAFSKHMASCRECQAEMDLWKGAAQRSFPRPEVRVPYGFSERVMSRILENRKGSRKLDLAAILDFLSLPGWEIASAFSVSLLVFSYFSLHFLNLRNGTAANSSAWVYSQTAPEQKLLSKKEIEKEDVLQAALGNGIEEEFEMEVPIQ